MKWIKNRFPNPVALKIKWINQDTDRSSVAYVGWSGSSSSLKRSCIEIGREFAQNIGLALTAHATSKEIILSSSYVEITPVLAKDAITIQIEPVSEDDWEIMVMNKQFPNPDNFSLFSYTFRINS